MVSSPVPLHYTLTLSKSARVYYSGYVGLVWIILSPGAQRDEQCAGVL